MTHEDRQRWDDRYRAADDWQTENQPFPWLVSHVPAGHGSLPLHGGLALDLACGLGHNAIWLAGQGYRVVGMDVSRVGLMRAAESARQRGVADRVAFVQADLDAFRPAPDSVDLISVIRYLNRAMFPALAAALRPGGVLIYATFNASRSETHSDVNPAYLLQPGELRTAFPGLVVTDSDERDGMSYLAARRA